MGGKKDISYFDAETQKCILDLARQMARDELARHIKKTWIVSKWKYLWYDGDTSKRFEETPVGKRAIQLYCPETNEYKDV